MGAREPDGDLPVRAWEDPPDAPLSNACRARFSERKGTPLFDARLSAEKATAVLAHVAEGSAPARPLGSPASTRTPSPGTPDGPATTRPNCTTSWSLFPPKTVEVQLDEKWAFVGKTRKSCADDDTRRGDCGDHVALDPESRLVVSLVVGKRTADATHARVRDFRRRTGDRVLRLMTSDEYPGYEEAIRDAYGRVVVPREPVAEDAPATRTRWSRRRSRTRRSARSGRTTGWCR